MLCQTNSMKKRGAAVDIALPKGVFQPDSFCLFEASDARKRALTESLRRPLAIVWAFAHEIPCPDFPRWRNRLILWIFPSAWPV